MKLAEITSLQWILSNNEERNMKVDFSGSLGNMRFFSWCFLNMLFCKLMFGSGGCLESAFESLQTLQS